MKPKLPHHTTVSLMLQKLAVRYLWKVSIAVAKLNKIHLFSSRKAAHRSTPKLEYQFSASSSPLIHRYYYKKQSGKQHGLRSFLAFLCPCFYLDVPRSRWDDEDSGVGWALEAAPTNMMLPSSEESEDNTVSMVERLECGGENDDCVDMKAERFIARFYEEMRKQRRESIGSPSCEVSALKL